MRQFSCLVKQTKEANDGSRDATAYSYDNNGNLTYQARETWKLVYPEEKKERDSLLIAENRYQCCFCDGAITPNGVDITTLIVISNWEKNEERQREQQFFCHVECLRSRLSRGLRHM